MLKGDTFSLIGSESIVLYLEENTLFNKEK